MPDISCLIMSKDLASLRIILLWEEGQIKNRALQTGKWKVYSKYSSYVHFPQFFEGMLVIYIRNNFLSQTIYIYNHPSNSSPLRIFLPRHHHCSYLSTRKFGGNLYQHRLMATISVYFVFGAKMIYLRQCHVYEGKFNMLLSKPC